MSFHNNLLFMYWNLRKKIVTFCAWQRNIHYSIMKVWFSICHNISCAVECWWGYICKIKLLSEANQKVYTLKVVREVFCSYGPTDIHLRRFEAPKASDLPFGMILNV